MMPSDELVCERRERGIALILVIWVIALLSVVAMVAAGNARTDLQIARNLLDGAKARSLADGGVWWMMARLLDRNSDAPTPADGTATRISLGGQPIDVAVQDEGGKIDVNHANATLLGNLCRVVGIAPAEADGIADAIIQYRERNRREQPATARAFSVVEELRLVPGIDPERYERMLPFVTVYTRDGHINPRTAPREVILALPGILPLQAEEYLRLRSRNQPGGAAAELPPSLANSSRYLSMSPPRVVTITAVARRDGHATSIREAVVELTATPERPLRVIAWRRGEDAVVAE
jgi:general secretion pathway protein K